MKLCKFEKTLVIRPAIFGCCLLLTGWTYAQQADSSQVVDISTVKESLLIIGQCDIYVDSSGKAKEATIPANAWKSLNSFKLTQYIPVAWITKTIYLRFTLENKTDTANTVFFIIGSKVRRMEISKVLPGNTVSQIKDESLADGYQPLILNGRHRQAFIAKFNFTKRNFNYIQPRLIRDGYLVKYKNLRYFRNDAQPAVGYILSGILLMMIFFTAANYIQSKKREFFYNCCYSTCMFLLIFLNTFLERKSGFLSNMFNEYLDFMLLAAGTVFYIAFTRMFLDTKANYPLLNKIFVIEEKLITIILAAFTFIVFFTDYFQLQKWIENGMKFIALIIGVAYIIIALSQRNKLMNYLAIGNGILIFFSAISFYVILFLQRNDNIFTNSMVYYETGIVSELIFFLLGLAYKTRTELIEKIKEQESLKLEAERLSYETRLAVLNAKQRERNRISADMHDDLGAGVTAIRLYSELAKKRIGKDVIPEIEKISSSANELLNNMNAIIWTMSSSNDSLDNMVAYIRSYALEYFENTGIRCHIQLEENLPHIAVSGEIRRNVFMVMKEALNNILKHSGASEVHITLKKEMEGLSLYIHDNGKGIDFDNLRRFGNGLINMKKRMEETQIHFLIENNNGTLIKLYRKLEV